MKECMLPTSTMMEELSIILFRINKLKNGGVKSRNGKNGKNLITLTALKTSIQNLSSKFNITDKEVEICYNNNTSKSSSISSTKTTNEEQPILMVTSDNLMETNIDRLTNDVLILPRENRPICLAHDQTMSSKATADKDQLIHLMIMNIGVVE